MLATAELGGLVAAFSVTHIGLSAVREPLIRTCGSFADTCGLVGSGLKLPTFWLADTSGLEVWPTEETAGRQIYRAGYTAVASALLFPALASYPASRALELPGPMQLEPQVWWAIFAIASVAQGISIASLFNPSPLSLVPGFEGDPDALLGIRRDDTLKLEARGLTRITRHPLILPVVPWGIANALLAGGHDVDVALFGGLAIYAVAGCYAQDLRVTASAQVGTVFKDGKLEGFFKETSFVPFGACLDGRQSLGDAVREVPTKALAVALPLGVGVEWVTLQLIGVGAPS